MCFFFLFRLFHISIYTEDFRNHNFSNFFRNVWVGIFFLLFLYRAFIDWVIYFTYYISLKIRPYIFYLYFRYLIFMRLWIYLLHSLPNQFPIKHVLSRVYWIIHFFQSRIKHSYEVFWCCYYYFIHQKWQFCHSLDVFFLYLNNLSNINYWWVFNTFVSFQAFVFLSTN